MTEPMASAVELIAQEHQLNLRQLQEEALETLYVATSAAGFGLILLALQYARYRPFGLLGIPVMLLPLPLHRLLSRHYLADAWALVGLWLGLGSVLALSLPATPVPCLLALPVGLAAWFIGAWAGLVTGGVASLVTVLPARGPATAESLEALAAVLLVIWGVYFLTWLSLRPATMAVRWS